MIMRKFTSQLLGFLLILIAIGCNKIAPNNAEGSVDISFEDFMASFAQIADIKGINQENGLDFRESPEIEMVYFQSFLQDKSYANHLTEKLNFLEKTIDNQDITYRFVSQISLDSRFHSLIISANLEGDPTHEWAYYLINYTKKGSYIDGILLSYRNSYESEEATEKVSQSEYRYVSFLPKNQLHFTDISYDNTLQSRINSDDMPFSLTASSDNDTQYFRESWYQIEEKGTFKQIKTVERNKNEVRP